MTVDAAAKASATGPIRNRSHSLDDAKYTNADR